MKNQTLWRTSNFKINTLAECVSLITVKQCDRSPEENELCAEIIRSCPNATVVAKN